MIADDSCPAQVANEDRGKELEALEAELQSRRQRARRQAKERLWRFRRLRLPVGRNWEGKVTDWVMVMFHHQQILVGGLEHFLFSIIYGIIIPTD